MYLTNFQWKLFRFITSFNLYCHLLAIALQKYGFWRAKRGFLRCKKWVFTLQKGGFYTPKTPFLFFVSITNTLLMCYEYSVKWLRTFHKMPTKHSTTTQRTHCYFGVNIKKGPHKWNPFNCKPSAITIANRLQQCHKRPRSIVFLQSTRASGALWF